MPLMDHLRELRNRVVKALLFVALGVVVGFWQFELVWDFLQRPYCALPQSSQLDSDGCNLIYTGIFDAFFLQFKVAIIIGIVLSCPFWLYQLWAFVAPALRGKEKRYTYVFVGAAVPLFLSGAALAYYITEKAMQIMFSFGPDGSVPLITMDNYLSYIIMMLLVFGAAFVLPLIVVLLNFLGVLPHEAIAKWRRMIIFVAFVFAAVATPGGDPITMMALGVPVVLLFELAELIAFLHDRRLPRRDPYAGLGDDEISSIDDEEDETSIAPNR
ncbi:twin-arginine translocase subunit TatC [Marinitenerispora sediminis]|uniref:Sec-independent protein translocase protein TatC n=1 Tax=Marinitenerispora sediminis TaxID=1931232 RepID=A0A368T7Z9_9ACTN|nr:twin-arginine translocase subunit TatC [Marinitenerispora sediminis]RCV57059.1 twin-arginine translocase subunit TatC [Marinitenerispora sediminis]RCV59948.1 twin-arginine translocase subunit TatC [Marinitenerispora sediminis]